MNDVLQPILENDLLNEEAKTQIKEAFEAKLDEVRQETEVQLREEFAARYEHDKDILLQAVERMVAEGLQAEIAEFHEDRSKLSNQQVKLANEIREARIEAKRELNEKLKVLETFVLNALKTELNEFAEDRTAVREAKKSLAKQIRESRVAYKQQLVNRVNLVENFVMSQLKTEISEFQRDKKALVEQRVKMITEGKKKIEETRKEFIKRASNLVESKVSSYLQEEMTQFKEDIKASREKSFGQKIFDSVAAEFKASFFNENAEIRKLSLQLSEAKAQMGEAKKLIEHASKVAEESKKRQKLAESAAQRSTIMAELLGKLSGAKRDVMSELLEGVKTGNLREAFKKYVPAVTRGNGETILGSTTKHGTLNESKVRENRSVFTGDRKNTLVEAKEAKTTGEVEEFERIKKLAGL